MGSGGKRRLMRGGREFGARPWGRVAGARPKINNAAEHQARPILGGGAGVRHGGGCNAPQHRRAVLLRGRKPARVFP